METNTTMTTTTTIMPLATSSISHSYDPNIVGQTANDKLASIRNKEAQTHFRPIHNGHLGGGGGYPQNKSAIEA